MTDLQSPMAIVLLKGYEETREEIWHNVTALEHHEQNIDAYLRSLGPVYAARDELRARIAELRGPIRLPRPRNRTPKQERVARCPRCGGAEAPKWKVSTEEIQTANPVGDVDITPGEAR